MKFKLKIVQPTGVFFEGEVTALNVRTSDGYIGVLPNHVPIITSLEISPLKYWTSDSQENLCAISGGFMYLGKNDVTIVTDNIQHAKDIDINKARELKSLAERRLKDKEDTENSLNNQVLLKRSINLISTKTGKFNDK